MNGSRYVPLPGSARAALTDVEVIGDVQPEERIEFTIVLRRRAELPTELVEGPDTVAGDQFAERYGADPADVERVRDVLASGQIELTNTHHGSRRMSVAGPA